MSKTLVVLRCGRRSKHPGWVEGAGARTFDLCLCPYEDVASRGDVPGPDRPLPGQKWSGLAAFLAQDPRWRGYDHVWLPDDDLEATPEALEAFFERCRRHDAALAAPALEEGSEASHLLTLRNRAFVARETTFVEVMAPCFRRDVLELLLPTFSESPTGWGWGLDDVWARRLSYRGLWVFDDATVRHARPVGAARSAAQVKAAEAEMRAVRARHDACSMRKTTAGHRADGTRVAASDPAFPALYDAGYRWFLDAHPEATERMRRHQEMDPEAWLRGERPRDPWWRRVARALSRGAGDAGA